MRTVGVPRSTALPRLVFGMGAAGLALAGCAELEVGAEAVKAVNRSIEEANREPETPITRAAAGSQINPNLQPAPEQFEARGLVVWDGVRTLQGIWVAHPKAETARRVRIIDAATRRAVDGALFRRDEALTGSSILISSEAATLLQLNPGEKSELLIVALKPGPAPVETAAVAETPEESAVEATAEAETGQDVELAALSDPIEDESAALDTAEPEAEAEPQDTAEAEDPVAEPEAAVEPEAEALETDAEPEPAETEAVETEIAPEPEAEPEAETVQAPPVKPTPPVKAEGPEEQIALADPEATEAQAEATESPDFTWQQPEPAASEAEAEPEAEPAETEAAPRPQAGLYVVAGTFGVKDNAVRLVKRIEDAGFPSDGQSIGGGRLTRVVAGPFADSDAQASALEKIRAMGLPDAIAIKN